RAPASACGTAGGQRNQPHRPRRVPRHSVRRAPRAEGRDAPSRSARGLRGRVMTADVNRRVLPGFTLSLGYTLLYMSLLVAIPLAAGFLKASQLSLGQFWAAVSSDRAVAAYLLTVGASFVSALINALFGLLVAWVLVRYDFPLKRLFDSLV